MDQLTTESPITSTALNEAFSDESILFLNPTKTGLSFVEVKEASYVDIDIQNWAEKNIWHIYLLLTIFLCMLMFVIFLKFTRLL